MRKLLFVLGLLAGCSDAQVDGCTTWQECFPGTSQPCSSTDQCPAGNVCNWFSGVCMAPECAVDADCPRGEVCETEVTFVPVCGTTCTCSDNAQAVAQGFGSCDTSRATCLIGPVPSCAGAVTCAMAAPSCPATEVPLILDGCYSGDCQTIASCDLPPACTAIGDEASCTARPDCAAVIDGLQCTNPNGAACTSGDAACTCKSYVFASCGTPPAT